MLLWHAQAGMTLSNPKSQVWPFSWPLAPFATPAPSCGAQLIPGAVHSAPPPFSSAKGRLALGWEASRQPTISYLFTQHALSSMPFRLDLPWADLSQTPLKLTGAF
jgi:hypothetical protein